MEAKTVHQKGSGGKLYPICAICGSIPEKGICGGIRLKKGFICYSCERKIVGLAVGEGQYEEIREKIKAIMK